MTRSKSNGSGNGHDDRKIASLSQARAERARREGAARSGAGKDAGAGGWKESVVGWGLIALGVAGAVGFIGQLTGLINFAGSLAR